MMKILFCIIFTLVSMTFLSAQVGINTNDPDPSAILDVRGADGGLLIPRGTAAQRNAIQATKPGLLFYDVSLERMFITRPFNDTMMWMPLGPIWQESATSIFLDQPFLKKLGVGTSNPSVLFEVDGKSRFNDTMMVAGFMDVPGMSIFNDTMMVTKFLNVPGRSIFNDTMMISKAVIADDLVVNGRSNWNDTMMVGGFMDVSAKSVWNDTILAKEFLGVKDMQVNGVSSWNDTMMVTKFLDVTGKAVFNDTIMTAFQEVSGLEVTGKTRLVDSVFAKTIEASQIILDGPEGDSPRPVFIDAAGRLGAWNDTMMVTFSALDFESSQPININFGENVISANLGSSDGGAMWFPVRVPERGLSRDSLFFSFIDASPTDLTITLQEMKNDGSGFNTLFSFTTNGNVPNTVRTLKADVSSGSAPLDPRRSTYFIRVAAPNWATGSLRVIGGSLSLKRG